MRNLLNKFFTTLIFIVLVQVAYGQTKAVTETGDTIYVYDNGTWSFELIEGMPAVPNEMAFLSDEIIIDTILTEFSVSAKANKEVRDKRDMFVIKYDDSLWKRVPPATLNEEAEFAFQSKVSDIWCVVIAEETPIASDKLLLIAKNTMKDATGSTPEILKTELRSVNGHDLIRGVLGVEISGIAFTFDTYYFSNDSGSVQFITWTSDNVWERYQKEILKFLNGFIVN